MIKLNIIGKNAELERLEIEINNQQNNEGIIAFSFWRIVQLLSELSHDSLLEEEILHMIPIFLDSPKAHKYLEEERIDSHHKSFAKNLDIAHHQ